MIALLLYSKVLVCLCLIRKRNIVYMGNKIFSTLKYDIPASIVVLFVTPLLCLGIALVSEAPRFSVLIIPDLLNKVPLSVFAAVLLVVGYELTKPTLFSKMYALGWKQFIPFTITVLGIVFIDLLYGIGQGLLVAIIVILVKSCQNSYFLHTESSEYENGKMKMTLAEKVTFFNKGSILKELDNLSGNSYLELGVQKMKYLNNHIIEIVEDCAIKTKERNITIKLVSERDIVENPLSYIDFFKLTPKRLIN